MDEWEAIERACFSDPWTRGMMEDGLDNPLLVNLALLSEDGRLAGYGCMYHVCGEGCVSNIAVAPNEREKGLGGALLDELIKTAQALELEFVTLEVRVSNQSAIGLYSSRGFEPAGVRPGYYEHPHEDALLMTKPL